TLRRHGAVSEAVAREMAEGALAASGADLALSVTGVAGPGGSDDKPEGLVCFGVAVQGGGTWTEQHEFGPIGREKVRALSVKTALQLALNAANR
ncbi:MAG: CinA family protein, partial [Paracoccaceae bacterium]